MAKSKKRLTRSDKITRVITITGVALGLLIALIVSSISNNGFRLDVFFGVFIPVSSIIFILFIIFTRPSLKGKMGEAKVAKILKSIKRKYGGYIVNNVIIPDMDNENNTSQLDHVYLSTYGIFVLETKNYAGMIFGKEEANKWTQTLAYGKSKNTFYNPVKQNLTHIYRLSRLLKINKINSVVVFIQADISNVVATNVVTLYDLKDLLKQLCINKEEINIKQVKLYYEILNDFKMNPIVSNRKHIKNIKQQSKNIDKNICPRCGAKLVLRKSTKTGKEFYGCSNYPNCKFIK